MYFNDTTLKLQWLEKKKKKRAKIQQPIIASDRAERLSQTQ